jgi:16S rRNA (guanine(966)-N(2))-methyltransferase RsmD
MKRAHRTSIRIVAGSLRGRRLDIVVHPELRPTPQMVREALFSILGDAIPERPFFDVFSGTGAIGLEAISRGASTAVFVERDVRLAAAIAEYLREFKIADRGQIVRTDVYRWAERWRPAADQPLNLFLSPPFADLTDRIDDFLTLVETLREKLPPGSVMVVQAEEGFPETGLPEPETWERRKYGRNLLLIHVRLAAPAP